VKADIEYLGEGKAYKWNLFLLLLCQIHMLIIIMAISRQICDALGTVSGFSTFPFFWKHVPCAVLVLETNCYKSELLRSSKCTVETASLSWGEESKKSKFFLSELSRLDCCWKVSFCGCSKSCKN